MNARVSSMAGLVAWMVVAAGTSALSIAQSDKPGVSPSPLDAATASPADKPLTLAPVVDEDVDLVHKMLSGTFHNREAGEQAALHYGGGVLTIDGLSGGVGDTGVLFDVAPEGKPLQVLRIGVMQAYKRQGQLRLRVYDLVGKDGVKDVYAGLWASPDEAPRLNLSMLTPSVDVPLLKTADGYAGSTEGPAPTMRNGAVEMTCAIKLENGRIEIADAGFDAQGKQVWGSKAGEAVRFSRYALSLPRTAEPAQGLTVVTLVFPKTDAKKLAPGGELTAHYSGWLVDGTRFDSSRQPGRTPFQIRIPGPVITGWNEGLAGIAEGEVRKLVIPGAMAYGVRGRGQIPPNAMLVFEVECLSVNNEPPKDQVPPPMTPPQGGQPIGKPPTNANPEQPR